MKSFGRASWVILSIVFFLGFALTLWIGWQVPVYSDEYQWNFTNSRLLLDSGKLLYFFPGCADGFLLNLPWTWLPSRFLDSLLFADASNPYLLRNTGWVLSLVLIAMWSGLLKMSSGLTWRLSFLFVASFLGIGVLPFLLAFHRPEQTLLLWLTLTLLVGVWFIRHPVKQQSKQMGLCLLYALLACLLVGSHPKGMFFLPLVLWASYKTLGRRILVLVVCLTALVAAWQTIGLWSVRTNCPESQALTEMFYHMTVKPANLFLFHHPEGAVYLGRLNLAHWQPYIQSISFGAQYQSNWLPPKPTALQWPLVNVANGTIWLALFCFFSLLVWNLGKGLQSVVKGRGLLNLQLAAGLLLGCLILQLAIDTKKSFYESALVWPVILLVVILSFPFNSARLLVFVRKGIIPVLMLVAILGGLTRYEVFKEFLPSWQESRNTSWHAVNLELQQFANEQCQIGPDAKRLILDDRTYPAFWKNSLPMLSYYVYGWWSQGMDYHKTIEQHRPDGLVTYCYELPPDLEQLVQKKGAMCCASKKSLEQLFLHR